VWAATFKPRQAGPIYETRRRAWPSQCVSEERTALENGAASGTNASK
jgi:hypothetical protein